MTAEPRSVAYVDFGMHLHADLLSAQVNADAFI